MPDNNSANSGPTRRAVFALAVAAALGMALAGLGDYAAAAGRGVAAPDPLTLAAGGAFGITAVLAISLKRGSFGAEAKNQRAWFIATLLIGMVLAILLAARYVLWLTYTGLCPNVIGGDQYTCSLGSWGATWALVVVLYASTVGLPLVAICFCVFGLAILWATAAWFQRAVSQRQESPPGPNP